MERLFWICMGGAAGTGARYLLSGWVLKWCGTALPFGTFTVNLLGSFSIGVVMCVGLSTEWMSPTLRLALTTGVLGGFTTYSTFSYETMLLLQDGAWWPAALNIVLTVTACLTATFLGLAAGRWLVGG